MLKQEIQVMIIYNTLMNCFASCVKFAATVMRPRHPGKTMRFIKGRKGLIDHIRKTYTHDGRKVMWVHSASFGEFSVARPLITEFRRRGMLVVATFFSPSGYEAVKGNKDVDFVYYLPIDTARNAAKFLDIIRPDKAVFTVSEYWYNFLKELRHRDIDTYLVSAKITEKSIFFKWYGMVHRKCLDAYKHIFVINEESRQLLAQLGHDNVSINGNPLFDNAIAKAAQPWSDAIIEKFTSGHPVFIAGSIHDDNDLKLVTNLANNHPDIKFLMVPHEISTKSVNNIVHLLKGKTAVYSECTADTDFSGTQSLIIDFMGALAYIYRYANWAYVGGGFTRYLHSLVEATVYGLPVSFGPNIGRKITPKSIISRGLGNIVCDSSELDTWLTDNIDTKKLETIKHHAKDYVNANAGATDKIVNDIL